MAEKMADKIVTSLFDTLRSAELAVSRVEAAGTPARDISLWTNNGAVRTWSDGSPATGDADVTYSRTAPSTTTAASTVPPSGSAAGRPTTSPAGRTDTAPAGRTDTAATGFNPDALADWLARNGVDEDDADGYAEGVRRGGALVVVRCAEEDVDRVLDALDQEGVHDLDERRTAWRGEGWMGRERRPMERPGKAEARIPVTEEKLTVGKRPVGHGRVRIHSHLVRTPVRERVDLRDEHVKVERRPVDRPVRDSEAELFRDRAVEMTESGEEPVVSKQPRVTEEVVLRKDVDHHTETVSDDVRRTEVEIEDERKTGADRATGTADRGRR